MPNKIYLRTLCGCEKIIDNVDDSKPYYQIPVPRLDHHDMLFIPIEDIGKEEPSSTFKIRTFQRTSERKMTLYGMNLVVYKERVDDVFLWKEIVNLRLKVDKLSKQICLRSKEVNNE